MIDIWLLILLVVASVIVGFDVGYSAGKRKIAKVTLKQLDDLKKAYDRYNTLVTQLWLNEKAKKEKEKE